MPVYQVELPDGRTVGFEGENPPTEHDYNELVASFATPEAGPKTNQGAAGDLEALLVGGGLNVPSAAAGLAGMGFGATRTPGGPIPKLVGGLIGGLVAGGGTRYLQSKAEEAGAPAISELERNLATEHPKSTLAAQLLTSGFGIGKLAPTLAKNIVERLAPASIGAGIQGAREIVANKDKPGLVGEGAAGRIGESALEMAILNKETNLGSKFMGLGSKLASATTHQTLAGANAAANDIAMEPSQPMNVGAPQDLTGPVRNLGDFQPTEVQPPVRNFGDYQPPLTLEEQAFIDQNKKIKKTPNATDVQKQIESDLGIGQKKGITETQVEHNARVKEEAQVRNEIEQAQKAAQDEINKNLGVDQPKGRAQVDPANQTVLSDKLFNEAAAPTGKPDAETGPTLNELAGQQVEWNGKKGTLIQDNDLTWQVMPDVQKPGGPVVVHDITGAKGNDIPAKDVKVVPKGGSQNRFGFLAPALPGIGDPLLGAGVGKLAAKLTGQDQDTEDEWTKRGFIIGAGAGGLVRFGTRAQLQNLGAAAFHGTPHEVVRERDGVKVPAFDISKIGTGEGAQAYGHGLYFAENPKVAESYKKATRDSDPHITIDGKPFYPQTSVEGMASAIIFNANGDVSKAIKDFNSIRLGLSPDTKKAVGNFLQAHINSDIEAVQPKLTPGNIYKVDIKANDDELLHWDKPLREQSKKVQDGILKLDPELTLENAGDMEGSSIYRRIAFSAGEERSFGQGENKWSGHVSDEEMASKILNDYAGIKGIKYADQGSRGSVKTTPVFNMDTQEWQIGNKGYPSKEAAINAAESNKTNNYVIFNDKNVEITHKNGEPVKAPKGGVSGAGEGGLIVNPFRMKTPPTIIGYKRNANGTFDVNYASARSKEASGGHKLEDLLKNGGTHSGLTVDELVQLFGQKVAGKIVGGHGFRYNTNPLWTELIPTTHDFASKFGSGGAVNPAVVGHLGGAAAGAAIGYQTGDTPEEKARNAILGGLIGLGGVSSARAALAMGPRSKSILDQIKALSVDSSGKPSTLETLTNQTHADAQQKPASLPLDSQPGSSPEIPEVNPEGSKAPRARKPISQKEGETPEDYRTRLLAGLEKIQNRVESSKSVDVTSKQDIRSALNEIDVEKDPIGTLEEAHNRALEMEAEGRGEVKSRNALAKQDIQDIVDELQSSTSAELKPGSSLERFTKDKAIGEQLSILQNAGRLASNAAKTVGNTYKAISQHTSNRDVVFNLLDGYQKFRGALNRTFGKELDLAYNDEQNLKSDWKDNLRTVLKGKELSPKSMERVNIYAVDRMNRANPDLPNTHLEDSNVKPEVLEDIRTNGLTPEEQSFYNEARRILDTQSGPAVREAMQRDFNVEVGQIKDYWPTQVIGRKPLGKLNTKPIVEEAGHDAALDDLVKAMTQNFTGRPSTKVNQGQTIEKVKNAGGEINLSENLIDRHLNQAAHLVAQAGTIQKLGKVARQKFFAEKYGQEGQRYVLDLLDTVARDSAPANSTHIEWIDKLTKNYAVAILARRVFSQLKHASNLAYAGREVGPSFVSGFIDSNTSVGKHFLKKNFAEAYQRSGGEGTIQELLEGNRWQNLQGKSFVLERILDQQIAGAATLAAYKNELIAKGKSVENYLSEPIDKDAQHQAMITARKIVTSSLKKDAPQAITRGKLMGGDMTATRAAFQFGQTALRQIHYIGTELKEASNDRDVIKASTAVAAVLAGLAIESGMVEASRKFLGAPEKKGENASFGQDMAIEAVRKVPGAGNLIAALGHGDAGIPAFDITTHGLHAIGELASGKNQFATPLKGKTLQSTRADALTFAGSLAGVPGAATAGQYYKNKMVRK